ncbi:MAG TPA: MOSC domain-containing protein [Burkholderiaceae bacterium]|nr:MOSC domain-containing protein [Burkholderiaceae bacterium]
MVRRLNVDGDGQGDLSGHGGEQRAVLVYQVESYRYWEQELGRAEFPFGQFGENFTVEGLADAEVFVGDRYRIGSALFEVTQPRVTCYRVGIRMDEARMASLLVSHGRPGFYLRVLQEGEVGAGDEVERVLDGAERMTVAQINALLYLPGHGREDLQRALRIPALSPGWKGSFQALLREPSDTGAASGNPGLSSESGPPPAWPGFRTLRISRIDHESAAVLSLILVPSDGLALAMPLPGQFVVLRLKPTPDESPILRSYSLSGAPAADHYRISVKQEVKGEASRYLHQHAKAGDLLDVSAPRGAFTLDSGKRPVVLLGAGVGITPLLAMLHALAADAGARPVWWCYGAHNGADHPFASESTQLLRRIPKSHRHIVYSRPADSDIQGDAFDALGHLDVEALRRLNVPRDADFYLCGPSSFLRDLRTGLSDWGVPADRIHTEFFGAGETRTPGITETARRPHSPSGPAGQGPRVSFVRTDLSVRWDPRFHTLLDLAEVCDIPVRWSCRTGVCHTCEVALISGGVRYDPDPLEAPAAGSLLTCCAQPVDDVVIDL